MSDNEGYEDIRYYARESPAHGQSSTSNRNHTPRCSSPRYNYSLETNIDGEITIRRLTTAPDYVSETVSYKNEKKPNKSPEGQSTAKQHTIEVETIDDEPTTTTTAHTNAIQKNEIQLQCMECIRCQQNSRQEQQEQQLQDHESQYANEYSEPSSPKKKSFCAPVYSSVICRMAILTAFFVILSFLCFINIYLFIFIFVSIVVVIFVNMGAQEQEEGDEWDWVFPKID